MFGGAVCAVSCNPSHTHAPVLCSRTVSCFGAVVLKINWKNKDFSLLSAMQFVPTKFYPSLCIALYWKREELHKRFSLCLPGQSFWTSLEWPYQDRNKSGECTWFSWSWINTWVYSTPLLHPWSSAQVWVVFVLFFRTECHGRCVWMGKSGLWLAGKRQSHLWAHSGFFLCLSEVSEPASVSHTWLPKGTLFAELLAVHTSQLNLLSDTTL